MQQITSIRKVSQQLTVAYGCKIAVIYNNNNNNNNNKREKLKITKVNK